MARAEGSLNIVEQWAWRVFDSPGFAGNPTRVHALEGPADTATLLAHSRSLSSEDNAYFWPEDGGLRVRFFSHSAELRLCGHALLACAETLLAGESELSLTSGVLRHRLQRVEGRPWVTLPLTAPSGAAPALLRSLLEDAGRHVEALHAFPGLVWVAALRSLAEVEGFQAEAFPWGALEGETPGALILACCLGEGYYTFRYFAPWHGKLEDPGTGSAQSFLAALWLQEGQLGRAWQVSPRGRTAMNLRRRDGELWLNGSLVPDDLPEGTAARGAAYTLGKR